MQDVTAVKKVFFQLLFNFITAVPLCPQRMAFSGEFMCNLY